MWQGSCFLVAFKKGTNMNIFVAAKLVPDDQDIQVAADRSLNFSKAKPIVSAYDLNAIEAAAQISAAVDGAVLKVVSVGPASVDDSKLKKNLLARGTDELVLVADDALADADARRTAKALADAIQAQGGFDLVICGDGSADEYAQQVDVQLACELGVPVVTAAKSIEVADGAALVERVLEDEVQTIRVALPAVISVVPDVALPRIPGMKDILQAGKKPMNVSASAGDLADAARTVVSCAAPEPAPRKLDVQDASKDGAIANFAQALKAAL